MELQKILHVQSNLEKEEWSGKYHVTWLQIIPQSSSNQNSVVPAQKQTRRSE